MWIKFACVFCWLLLMQMSDLLSTELVHEGEKVILQEMKSDSYENCIADFVRKARAVFLLIFLNLDNQS